MPRPTAADYLSRKLGRRITVSAMKWWAHVGQGPKFTVILRRASYRQSDLDAWIAEQDRK